MTRPKLPYAYVSSHVDRLYDKMFDEDDLVGIDKHCDFIREFINACGYSEDEFIRLMMGFEPLDTTSN